MVVWLGFKVESTRDRCYEIGIGDKVGEFPFLKLRVNVFGIGMQHMDYRIGLGVIHWTAKFT